MVKSGKKSAKKSVFSDFQSRQNGAKMAAESS
jgi:hypothetical protein